MHDKKALSTKAQFQFLQFFICFFLKTTGVHKKSMQFEEAINISIKTCIISLITKKSKQPLAQGCKFHPYGPSKGDSVCKQTSTSISYLGFPKFIQKYCIINEEASILFQVCKRSTKGFLCNEIVSYNFIRTGSGNDI